MRWNGALRYVHVWCVSALRCSLHRRIEVAVLSLKTYFAIKACGFIENGRAQRDTTKCWSDFFHPHGGSFYPTLPYFETELIICKPKNIIWREVDLNNCLEALLSLKSGSFRCPPAYLTWAPVRLSFIAKVFDGPTVRFDGVLCIDVV